MITKFVKFLKCGAKSVHDLVVHDGVEHAGYLSFLLMLTIFPFLVFFMATVGFIGNEALGNQLVDLILESSWANFIDALKPRIIEITSSPPQSLLTIAIISAIWTASSIFEGLRTILNKAYRVSSPPAYILRRLFSFVEFIIAVVIIISFLISLVFLPWLWGLLDKLLHINDYPILLFFSPESEAFRYVLLFSFGLLLICFSYFALPNRKQKMTSTFPGGFIVLIGWTTFSVLFKFYIYNFPQVNVIYGSIAGIIIALLYFYVCSLIYIWGAEMNYNLEIEFRRKSKKK
jgi:membrane protein